MASYLLFCYCIVCIFIASCALLLHHVHGYCVACMVIVSCAFLLHCMHCYCIMCMVIALRALLLHCVHCYCTTCIFIALRALLLHHVHGYCVACIVIALCALLLHHVHFYCVACIVIASCAWLLHHVHCYCLMVVAQCLCSDYNFPQRCPFHPPCACTSVDNKKDHWVIPPACYTSIGVQQGWGAQNTIFNGYQQAGSINPVILLVINRACAVALLQKYLVNIPLWSHAMYCVCACLCACVLCTYEEMRQYVQ